jgi:hypothetical protein
MLIIALNLTNIVKTSTATGTTKIKSLLTNYIKECNASISELELFKQKKK